MTGASIRRILWHWQRLHRSQEKLIVASQGERHYSVSLQMKLLHFEHLTQLQNLAVVFNRWSGAYFFCSISLIDWVMVERSLEFEFLCLSIS